MGDGPVRTPSKCFRSGIAGRDPERTLQASHPSNPGKGSLSETGAGQGAVALHFELLPVSKPSLKIVGRTSPSGA